MKAYTYLVKHKPSGRVYYGSRMSDDPENDLFITYFTSSKLVKRLIKEDGIESFEKEIRRIFISYEEARKWETKVLQKMNVIKNEKFLNQAISCSRICAKDSLAEQIRCKNIAEGMKKRWKDPDYRFLQENPSDERREKLREAARKSVELHGNPVKFTKRFLHAKEFGYSLNTGKQNGKYVSRPTSVYKIIKIQKNGIVKEIHRNQTSAYKKIGWERVFEG